MIQNGYTCNKCQKDYIKYQDRNNITKKVISLGLANVLCRDCEIEMKNKIRSIVVEYLEEPHE